MEDKILKQIKRIKRRAGEIEKEGESIVDSRTLHAVRAVNDKLGIGGIPLAVPLAYAEYLDKKRVEKKS